MTKYKIIHLKPGGTWPKYGVYEAWPYRGDIEDYRRNYCSEPGQLYYNNPDKFKADRKITHAGQVVEDDHPGYAVIVIDDEPVFNEFGQETP